MLMLPSHFTEVEAQLIEERAKLDCLTDQLNALLAVIEPEGVALAEEMLVRMAASQGRLEGFVQKVAGDAVQYTMGLVKSHFPKADLVSVCDSIPLDCSDEDWEANPAAFV